MYDDKHGCTYRIIELIIGGFWNIELLAARLEWSSFSVIADGLSFYRF
jgi:hypothetical protein